MSICTSTSADHVLSGPPQHEYNKITASGSIYFGIEEPGPHASGCNVTAELCVRLAEPLEQQIALLMPLQADECSWHKPYWNPI